MPCIVSRSKVQAVHAGQTSLLSGLRKHFHEVATCSSNTHNIAPLSFPQALVS